MPLARMFDQALTGSIPSGICNTNAVFSLILGSSGYVINFIIVSFKGPEQQK
jgi:hypothetical protein